MSLEVPRATPPGSRIVISALRVAGADVPGFPAVVTVAGPGEPLSLRAPLVLAAPCDTEDAGGVTPCVTPEGTIYVPSGGRAPGLTAFDASGNALALPSPLLAAAEACAAAVAYAPAALVARTLPWGAPRSAADSGALLILGGEAGLRAVDAATGAKRWATPPGDFAVVGGVAVVRPAGEAARGAVVVASSRHAHKAHAHALADGSRVATHRFCLPGSIASEAPASGSGGGGDGCALVACREDRHVNRGCIQR